MFGRSPACVTLKAQHRPSFIAWSSVSQASVSQALAKSNPKQALGPMVSTKRVRISTSGRFRTAVCLIFTGSIAVLAEPGSTGGSVTGGGRGLSGPRIDETPRPAEGDVDSFYGSWLFAGIGCHSSGVLPAIISHGKSSSRAAADPSIPTAP
ncbi:MAG: hypothetical protein ABI192_13100 [Bradyrhizobium sp.]